MIEVKDRSTDEVLAQSIKVSKIEEDDDGIISESHFEAKMEKEDENLEISDEQHDDLKLDAIGIVFKI